MVFFYNCIFRGVKREKGGRGWFLAISKVRARFISLKKTVFELLNVVVVVVLR
jgi:hypothetical protein